MSIASRKAESSVRYWRYPRPFARQFFE